MKKPKHYVKAFSKKHLKATLLSEEEIAKRKADKEYEPASVLLERIKKEKKKKK